MRAQAVRRPVAQRATDGPTDRDQQDAVIAQALAILS